MTELVDHNFQNPKTKPNSMKKVKEWVFANFKDIGDIFQFRKFSK